MSFVKELNSREALSAACRQLGRVVGPSARATLKNSAAAVPTDRVGGFRCGRPRCRR